MKMLAARLCQLCEKFPDFAGKYTGTSEDLRDWLNEKTNCHYDKIDAESLQGWINALETPSGVIEVAQ